MAETDDKTHHARPAEAWWQEAKADGWSVVSERTVPLRPAKATGWKRVLVAMRRQSLNRGKR